MKECFYNIIKQQCRSIFICGIIYIFMAALDLSAPFLSKAVFDGLVDKMTYSYILQCVLMLICLIVFRIGFNYFFEWLLPIMKCKAGFSLKMEILQRLRKISILAYQQYDPLYLNARINSDVEKVVDFFLENYVKLVINGLMLFVYVYIIATVSRSVALVVLLLIPFYLLLYKHFRAQLYDLSYEYKERDSELSQVFSEQLLQMEEVKIQGNYSLHNNYLWKKFAGVYPSFKKHAQKKSCFNRLGAVLYHAGQAVLLARGGYGVLKGEITVGTLIMLSQYLALIIDMIAYFLSVSASYQEVKVSLVRLKEIFVLAPEPVGTKKLESIEQLACKLSFSYIKDIAVLKDVCLEGIKGKAYGVTGNNGCGKSTFLKVLSGILPLEGKNFLSYNGNSASQLNFEYLRCKRIGYVTQKFFMSNKMVKELFEEIDEKITLNKLSSYLSWLTLEQLELVKISIEPFWQQNINTLSGGQKQMIAIVRVLCKKPDLLLLDEPCASLDAVHKQWLASVIQTVKEHAIVIMITHNKEMHSVCDQLICV